jgi:predicted small integral membrane protein
VPSKAPFALQNDAWRNREAGARRLSNQSISRLARRENQPVIEARIAKTVMVGSLAIFALLVTFDNLTDYGTNYEFVRHVLSMDTTFPRSELLYRRLTSPDLWRAAYTLIILGEGLTGLTLLIAAIVLLWHIRSDAARFTAPSVWSISARRWGFWCCSSGF